MKKLFFVLALFAVLVQLNAQKNDTISKTILLDEVPVVSIYNVSQVESADELTVDELIESDAGQEPSFIFKKFPSIISFSDNGTEYGYGYFRIRGLDQTRISATLDGMPWNEAEDFGIYFANSPDLMSSMHSIDIERGSISSTNGTAGYVGGISLESVNLSKDTISYGNASYGSYDTWHTSLIYNSGRVGKNALHLKVSQSQTAGYKDHGWNRSQAFTLKTGHWFNDRHNIEFLSMNGQHRNCQGWIGVPYDTLKLNPRANGNTSDETDHWIQSVNKLTYKGWFANNMLFTTSTYLQFQTGEYRFDLDNYMRRMVDSTWEIGTTGTIYDYGLTHYMYGNMSALKLYINNLNITAGYDIHRYQRQHFMTDKYSMLHLINVDRSEYYDNTGFKNDASAFISANWTLGSFAINGNIQYRYVDFTYKDNMWDTVSWNEDTYWNFLNGGVSAEYNIDNANKLYVRYVRTSREPTRTDMFGGLEYYTGSITTSTPETVNDIECGYTLDGKHVRVNLNGYYMKFNNERVLNGQYGMNGLPEHETAENSYRTGIELSADVHITKHLTYTFNGSWSENKIVSDVYGDKTHVLTPSWVINNGLAWSGQDYVIGLSQYYHSSMYVDMLNTLKVPEYFSLNIYGNYRIGNVELNGRINNITNRTNYQYGAEGPNGELLYFQEATINAICGIKIYF